ncbi:prenyltransferase/squalene oxidase repeat-containing protein [Paludisphaera mucosa]|uniref:Terpene cyclase/mutase family protein n=1 Tax=Paludisphaera mucosa TaxID=3030827 RepID=A0ABT6FDF3_9BACT|nr:prenyltransferase/squalene oxidase repeat-containing protein [Paludisphaera mucosa]MDG3005613.1 terpene cyclase/mutase family protein [Paludisphaera mucosa]
MSVSTRRSFLENSAGALAMAAVSGPLSGRSVAQEATPTTADALTAKAVRFLRSRQDADGVWSADRKEPGVTALAVTALLRSGLAGPSDPAVVKALAYLETFVKPEGGLPDAAHANYATAVALMAFHHANTDGRYDALVRGSQAFLKDKQWDEKEGKTPSDPFYGGSGYGGRSNRPDLSNTTFMLEALRDSGVPSSDPAYQRAVVFISRCQNLDSEFNDQPWAKKVNDGGFIYTPANGGTSMAPPEENGGLRSYASMTYAGLKSLIYAGLTLDDPRAKAALEYLKKHYTVDENPGLGQRGLYYYYQVFGKTLALLGSDKFQDAAGVEHDWRADLIAALAKRQGANGEWVNPNDGFMEGDANLVTAYGLLALASTRRKAS